MKHLLLVGTLLLIQLSGFSSEIENHYKTYVQSLIDLKSKGSTEQLESLLWERYSIERTHISLLGNVRNAKISRVQYLETLKEYLSYKKISVKLSIEKISHVDEDSVKGNLISDLKMNIYRNERLIEVRDIQAHVFFRKMNGKWKMVHSIEISSVIERNAGMCPCTIYSNNDNYLTEVFIPMGLKYDRKIDKFRFTADKNQTIINYKNQFYYLSKTNELTDSNKKLIAKVKGRDEAIKLILKKEYPKNCLGFE